MTLEQQRIAIAEAVPALWSVHGWKWSKAGFLVNAIEMRAVDPLNDLNAMHEAVQQFRYADTGSTLWHKNNFLLSEVVSRDLSISKDCVSFLWELQNATAAQRAEAFLRTIGKWIEPDPSSLLAQSTPDQRHEAFEKTISPTE